MMDFQDFLDRKRIHLIGIGGIGVSALARMFLARGAEVSGSDVADFPERVELERRGAKIFLGHAAAHISPEREVVIFSSAVKEENPELLEARRRGIPTFRYAEALGMIMKNHYGIGVSGTNGKTTTTAMLGKILETDGYDPLVIVGGKVPGWDKNLRLPDSLGKNLEGENEKENKEGREEEKKGGKNPQKDLDIFLVEADEYRRHMLSLSPQMIVLTNIEADHLDYYKDLDDIISAFSEFAEKLPETGALIYNADDANSAKIAEAAPHSVRRVGYSISGNADVTASEIFSTPEGRRFTLLWQGVSVGVFFLPLPGRFNVSNALAAAAAALALEISPESIRTALKNFTGTWRRFQKMGTVRGKMIISDYAHHPTAVQKTISAAKEFYPGKKILAVFQPHQRNRLAKFLEEFSRSFSGADSVLILENYDVAGRESPKDSDESKVTSQDLVQKIREHSKISVGYAKDIAAGEREIRDIAEPFDIILIMGAGDVHTIAENLVK